MSVYSSYIPQTWCFFHITSNRNLEFVLKFFYFLNIILDMQLHFTLGYYPEDDGQIEYTNQTLEQYLYVYCNCYGILEHWYFSFLFIYFSWFNISFLLTFFYFIFILFDNEEAHNCGYMTYHMMWGHRPRLGKSWLKETRKMILEHMYMV